MRAFHLLVPRQFEAEGQYAPRIARVDHVVDQSPTGHSCRHGRKAGRKPGLPALPFSGLATFSAEDNRTEGKSAADFHTLELFVANGFGVGRPQAGTRRHGGYFVDEKRATPDAPARDMDAARRLWEVSERQVAAAV